MAVAMAFSKLNCLQMKKMMMTCPFEQSSSSSSVKGRFAVLPARCTPPQQMPIQQLQVEAGIMCEPCNGTGWLLCDFCNGQKTNVQSANKRIYRRCPSCKAIGYILCSKCKVFKCVTFPNYDDGEDVTF